MRLNYLVLSLIITLFCTSTTLAKDLMDPVIVTATKIKTKDTKATYASEVYNREDIEQSGTKSLYDFLNQSTSIVTMPSAGNTFSQKIDMRGFGLTDGYKNIVVTINGRRLNNVDSVPQKLSEISINNIERIEITKGSGSVVHGDGATGGSIQIYTRDTTETTLEGSVGNYGISTGSFTTGHSDGKFILSASGDTYHQGGFSDKDPYGHRDSGSTGNYSTKLRYFPTESSEVFIVKDHAAVNIRYINYLSQTTWDQNPGSNDKGGGNGPTRYNFETSSTNNLTLGGTLELSNNLEASFNFTHQDKVIVLDTQKNYHNNAIDSSIKYNNGPLKFITGIQTWAGMRNADTWDFKSTDTAKKSNIGIFAQSSYDTGSTVFSLGLRGERVEYSYETDAKVNHFLAYDLGINKTLSDHLSIFSNLNYSFLAPDVDRLFSGVGAFQGFLNPAKTTTLNIGVNHVTSKNKMKLTLYGMTLKDELYYSRKDRGEGTFLNTNLDSTYKYGLELNNKFSFHNNLSANVNYAYTKAMIDFERDAGDELPQVSEHTVSLGVNYKPTSKSRVTVTNIYRSKMLMEEDFDNAEAKNNAYNSTNLSYTYSYKTDSGKGLFNWWQSGPRQADISLNVDNLFERSHGSWLRKNVIYPYQFTRNWRIGTKLLF